MNSPFPGMDPFIEACGLWEDFHHTLIEELKNHLAQSVPEKYLVRTGERTYVVLTNGDGERHFSFVPDVGVTTTPARETSGTLLAEPVSEAGPVILRAFVEESFRETFVEIREDNQEATLVTSLEVLSPTNKRHGSPGWDLFLRKRQALLLGTANVVAIDLLRGGQRMPMLDPWPNSPYTLLVARKHLAPTCRVWPAHYLHPLPLLPVPLLRPDPDVPVNLQALIEAIYTRSRYDRSVDYSKPLKPPLPQDEVSWLEQRVRLLKGQAP